MVKNFEKQTKELSHEEIQMIRPIILGFRKNHFGKNNSITSSKIIEGMRLKNYKITDARLRKIINHIRSNALAPICSSTSGYWYSNNSQEIKDEIISLRQRAKGIIAAADGMQKFLVNN